MGRLRDKLLAELEQDNRNAARELVSGSEEGGGGGFAAACAESNAALSKKLEVQAVPKGTRGTSRATRTYYGDNRKGQQTRRRHLLPR